MGAVALALTLLAAAVARADDPRALLSSAEELRAENTSLAARSRQALLELYSLETRLGGAERRLAALEARAAEVERRQATARAELAVARRNVAAADRRLAARLRTLYVEGDVDPLAILLGAESFDAAVTALEGLGRVAEDDRALVADVRASRTELRQVVQKLAARRAELAGLVADARATRDGLAWARSERASYLARLRGQQAFNTRLVDRLLAAAAAAEVKTAEITAAPASAPAPAPAPPPAKGTRMTVSSTGYCLKGKTATGIETAWGVVAVDPAVIPLGTKMYVPGYGDGVAADTGAAVKGNTIDLWFPSCEQAVAWGRQIVTITLK